VIWPHLDRQAATGCSGVAAIGVAQEFHQAWAAYRRETSTAAPQFTFAKADPRVTCYYFYLCDEDSGPVFIKVCAYFPYPAEIWVNGDEWAKRQAAAPGSATGTVVFAQRRLARLPMPFGAADQRAGYWWQISMRQVEV
jgi:hypothetical protein